MLRYFTCFVLLLIVLFIGCGQKESSNEEIVNDASEEILALEKTDPAGIYGKGISLSEKTMVSDILSSPEKYEGKQVLVSGTVVDVCRKRGCWIELSGDKEFQKIKVKVKDGEIVFPLSAKGQQATVEGIVEKLELSKEQVMKWKAHEAEEHGEEFDSTTVTGPMTIWRLKGVGAEIKS